VFPERALLWQAFDGIRAKCRVLVADIPGFFELRIVPPSLKHAARRRGGCVAACGARVLARKAAHPRFL
jgi:hypothetical protein